MIPRFLILLLAAPLLAADLPPDKGNAIPESGKRPVVITGKSTLALPKHDLPEGYTLEVAAASPLVTHPIMGCLDDKGRLFVGDAVGVNWNKAMLEANPPNRVLMLEDTDKDGSYDKSTVFADKMTFPQGACWLNGSLYVGSPPGIWKLTDTDNDGVADQREMIVGGFEYTGNAADVHGPFLHPNGRLYWCHGRKGHKVTQKDGTPVDESLACGIWSCKPDGSDVAWHSLGCGDNPVEVDFTRDGDIIGVQNLYYSQPRGDTIIHWLYGGVYERSDQLKAIAHLPRTLETMPVMYNFGHVAVSGCCFWKDYSDKNSSAQQFMVTHFNTQRLVRMELTPSGSTYKAVENEFLRLHNPDIHLTDVMEDADGSLLLLDTGGWFRIGCPSSLMAKSDLLGAVYRIKTNRSGKPSLASVAGAKPNDLNAHPNLHAMFESGDPRQIRHACDYISEHKSMAVSEFQIPGKVWVLPLDPATEHALILAASKGGKSMAFSGATPFTLPPPLFLKRQLRVHEYLAAVHHDEVPRTIELAIKSLNAEDSELARTAVNVLIAHPEGDSSAIMMREKWLVETPVGQTRMNAMEAVATAFADKPETSKLITAMLNHSSPSIRQSALRCLASLSSAKADESWFAALDTMLASGATPLLLDAIKKLKSPHFDAALQAIANDTKRPLALRLKALDAAKSVKLTGETFAMVKGVLADAASSSAAKIQAAGMIASATGTSRVEVTAGPRAQIEGA
ncbi:PVC-type heme-binding CxxCH protein [Prosthecobacter sp.]|uniref:PVC-type heme-binding CxxCH protein n=1 Tax=Prosthecobacter sp. TaxID=1965333 RepID=UPI003784A64F